MTPKEKDAIDDLLYDYPLHKLRIKRCLDWEANLTARLKHNWPSDISEEVRKYGTTIQKSENLDGEQYRAINEWESKLYHYGLWREESEGAVKDINAVLEVLPPLYVELVEQRYFKDKSMDDCIASIHGITPDIYKAGITTIRRRVGKMCLGLDISPKRHLKPT